jgi:hypothetical protein
VEDAPDELDEPTNEPAHAQLTGQTTAATGERPATKRPAATTLVAEENKRLRLKLEKVADESLCPITHELPFHPVMAEDSDVYEKSAIEEWIRRNEAVVRSPATGVPMGRVLIAAPQVRNTIESMVENGAIAGDQAEVWTKRLNQENLVKSLRQRAATGDATAMYHLGVSYLRGADGLPKDAAQAFSWLKQAADLGHVKAMERVGMMYCRGQGTTSSVSRAAARLSRAVELGSDTACCHLGCLYQLGAYGFEKDVAEASFYYAKIPNCTLKDLSAEQLARAAEWVQAHLLQPTTQPSD